ncbi:oocyte zinc finger protein XlCOF7.1-like [Bombina bombina]|uniref:oocyte zinc finger protein XlCOF7.1-like n=1 Tax=Bombina bombina TaxID=8345 RepID=UPI00235AB4C6|nr:oocyte zinc finger protein XlCOF7.1-like [Bombina bombina]XP_053577544.1 oocyte zinc finger protein XlCOF7.1-like [Bombina bombina]
MNKMNKYRKQMAEQFLSQALDIICLLTGEEYTIVKKTPSESSIRRLSREVPIKYDDVAVYFSMEEWDYIEGHKEHYKDVIMETNQALRTMEIPGNESPEFAGHSDDNLDAAELVQNIQPVETPSDVSAGNINDDQTEDASVTCQMEAIEQELCDIGSADCCDDNLNTEFISEEREDERLGKRITQAETDSGLCADENNAKISCNEEQTEYHWIRHITEAAEQETYDTIITGDVKTEVVLNAEQTNDLYLNSQLESVKQKNSDDIGTDSFPSCCAATDIALSSAIPSQVRSAGTSYSLIEDQQSYVGNKLFPCSVCGKCFTQKSHLVTHQKIHAGQKVFPCSICGKCFTQKQNLITHKKIHTDEKAFSCSECGKYFAWKSSLTYHKKIHTGEKPFCCSICGKCFYWQSHLITHQKIHISEKEFSCSKCGRCFNQKSSLSSHMKIHTGEKTFSCLECGKCFYRKSSLISHHKIHTVEKAFPAGVQNYVHITGHTENDRSSHSNI